MGTVRVFFIKKHPILHRVSSIYYVRSKAIHNEAFAYHHGGQLGLGGISGF